MSDHGSANEKSTGGSSRTQPSDIINEGKIAKEQIHGTIVKYALFLLVLLVIWNMKACFKKHKEEVATEKARAEAYAQAHPPAPMVKPEYPISGEGHATQEMPVKAFMDPMKTHYRPSRPARYVFAEDPAVFWDDTAGSTVESNSTEHHKLWLSMPAGKYLVYPLGVDRIHFRWWQ